MRKSIYEKFSGLMEKSLNRKFSSKERAEAFDKIYYDYVKEKGNDKEWDQFREKLRKKYFDPLSEKQKKQFGLTTKKMINNSKELKKFISKKPKSNYPVDIFYKTAYCIIRKLSNKKDNILDIGYGNHPTFIDFLNSKGYSAYGIEPFPSRFDKITSFKGTINHFPKKLKQKYGIILINMVFTINYTHHFSKKFKWELKNKQKLLSKLASLLSKEGYLILVDDIGTIFSRKDLGRKFKIIVFEKDNNGRITLLRKKQIIR